MKQLVNKNLITLKCVLFCFLSGIGCIYPFLPLHMLALGLDRGEARLISAVAPCVALLGPAILGPLIDKLSVGRGSTGGSTSPSGSGRLLRTVTALCLILSAVFYTLLLAVPYTERHDARRPQVLFMCDSEGAYVMQEACAEGMRCNSWPGVKKGVLAVGACEYGCADEEMSWLMEPFSTTTTSTTLSPMYNSVANTTVVTEPPPEEEDEMDFEVNPPHLCTDGHCLVYMQHSSRLRVPLALEAAQPQTNVTNNGTDVSNATDDGWCTYRGPFQCLVPSERLAEVHLTDVPCRPAVRCQVLDPYDEPDAVLSDAECRLVIGDPSHTFWSYFVIRAIADIWPTAALALLGTACVIATRETSLGRGDVGRQLAFGTLGLAIFPPLAGLAAEQVPDVPYLVPFIMHAVFMVIGALILLIDRHMPLSAPEWWWHTMTGALAVPLSAVRRAGAETAAVLAVVVLLGALWSGIDAYLPWTVLALNGTVPQVGIARVAAALPALPALFWAEALVDYVGHSNIFISAFTFYSLRYTGLAFSTSYAWVVVCELLEVFTLSLVWVTAMLYFRHLIPRKYTTTGQALPVIAHFCIGRCLGAVVGGVVGLEEPLASARGAYRALGVASLLAAGAYLALYHLLLAPRCAPPPAHPPRALLQGRCLGAVVGGVVGLEEPLASARGAYRALGVASLLAAGAYLALYHLLLAPRCAPPPAHPPRALLQGRCLGAVVGGVVGLEEPLASARGAYRALGVASLLAAGAYLALYHLLLAPRCAPPPAHPPRALLQGIGANGASNGSYSPMRVYHEERSRKGHFRY